MHSHQIGKISHTFLLPDQGSLESYQFFFHLRSLGFYQYVILALGTGTCLLQLEFLKVSDRKISWECLKGETVSDMRCSIVESVDPLACSVVFPPIS